MEKTYKKGEIVFDRMRPLQKLIVSRVTNNIYYCMTTENPWSQLLVFSEEELISEKELMAKKHAKKDNHSFLYPELRNNIK